MRQGRVHLAAGAVGADGEQHACRAGACRRRSGRPDARATRTSWRTCGPSARAASTRSGSSRSRLWSPAARSIPCLQAPPCQHGLPALGEITPPRLATPITSVLAPTPRCFGHGHVRQPHIGIAARQAELADAGIGAPVPDALRDLGRERVRRIAEEQQIGMSEASWPLGARELRLASGFAQLGPARRSRSHDDCGRPAEATMPRYPVTFTSCGARNRQGPPEHASLPTPSGTCCAALRGCV